MAEWPVAGFTSTGSKRPEALFGADVAPATGDVPIRMRRASGCRVWSIDDREYIDWIMALGAVALGYAHPEVNRAACEAVGAGVVGPLAPALEVEVADTLRRLMPWMEQTRFLKSGAEACAAAVRLARVATGRELVLGCGYHGWLDWCQSGPGVPAATSALYGELVFNDADAARGAIRAAGDRLACVITEPIVLVEPSREWLDALREETERVGALLVIDEIKTAGRIAVGGGTERYRILPDLVVLGKAIANGFPLAAVGGRREVMAGVSRTWISSTLATEYVSLAAARATLGVIEREQVPARLRAAGRRLLNGLAGLAAGHPELVAGVAGIPEMCFLQFTDERIGAALVRDVAPRGVLFKRSAYNFASVAHDEAAVDRTLAALDEALAAALTR
ncbi:MAG TPA: aminotransferase class III-fold pyridoxal phosphate-dependent enzyme [Gemmatimonadales bacterium]|nr:aminotransferase class III-fold pyridoxal phosphate-dependent enzyme [Gemmatimonadales bacterium]